MHSLQEKTELVEIVLTQFNCSVPVSSHELREMSLSDMNCDMGVSFDYKIKSNRFLFFRSMRIPSFAILCCCCCTHAFLAAKEQANELILNNDLSAKERFVRSIDDHEDHKPTETPEWTNVDAWTYGTLANALMGKCKRQKD